MGRFIQNILAVALMVFASMVSSAAICDPFSSHQTALASNCIASDYIASPIVASKTVISINIVSPKEGKRNAFRVPAAARRTKGGTGHVGLVVNTDSSIAQKYRYDAFGNREFWNSTLSSWSKNAMGALYVHNGKHRNTRSRAIT